MMTTIQSRIFMSVSPLPGPLPRAVASAGMGGVSLHALGYAPLPPGVPKRARFH